jgi:hypothetical protein
MIGPITPVDRRRRKASLSARSSGHLRALRVGPRLAWRLQGGRSQMHHAPNAGQIVRPVIGELWVESHAHPQLQGCGAQPRPRHRLWAMRPSRGRSLPIESSAGSPGTTAGLRPGSGTFDPPERRAGGPNSRGSTRSRGPSTSLRHARDERNRPIPDSSPSKVTDFFEPGLQPIARARRALKGPGYVYKAG